MAVAWLLLLSGTSAASHAKKVSLEDFYMAT